MHVKTYGGLLFILCVWMQPGSLVRAQDCQRASFEASRRYVDGNFDTSGLQESYPPGSQVRVPCTAGFVGFFKLLCLLDGWDHQGSKCQPKSCGHPGDADFAEFQLVKGDDFVFGSEVEYTCKPGSQMVSRSNRRHCDVSGWDGFLPVCEAIHCPEIHAEDDMQVTGENLEATAGHVLHFRCKQNHVELDGTKQIYCEETGQWSGKPPTCKVKSCGRPADVPLATLKGEEFVIGSEVQYTCQAGYQVVTGSRRRSCTLNGWDGTVPKCGACFTPLGMEHGLILDNQLTASSAYDAAHGASKARLRSAFYWYPNERTPYQHWLQVDLKSRKMITGIITQGARYKQYGWPYDYYVTHFKVSYSDHGGPAGTVIKEANGLEKIFTGNTDYNGQVKNRFDPPITSRFVRVLPIAWSSHIALRIELLGCED